MEVNPYFDLWSVHGKRVPCPSLLFSLIQTLSWMRTVRCKNLACAMLSVGAGERRKRASSKKASERKILFKYLSPPTSSYQNVKMCGEGRLHTLTMFVWSHVCNVSVDVKLSKLTNQRVTRSWYTEMRYWNQCLQAPLPRIIPAPTRFSRKFSRSPGQATTRWLF